MSEAPISAETLPAGETGTAVEHPPAAKGAFPPFDSSTFASQLLWLAITFALLYWLLAKVAIPRIAGILEARSGRIAGDVAKAEAAKSQSEAALAAYEKALAAARTNANAIAEGSRAASKAASAAERASIEADVGKKIAAAEARIGEIKTRALSEVGAIASEATSAIVKALIDADVAAGDVSAAVSKAMAGGR